MDQKQNKNILKAMWGGGGASQSQQKVFYQNYRLTTGFFDSVSQHLFISLSEEILVRVKRPKTFCLSSDGCFSL